MAPERLKHTETMLMLFSKSCDSFGQLAKEGLTEEEREEVKLRSQEFITTFGDKVQKPTMMFAMLCFLLSSYVSSLIKVADKADQDELLKDTEPISPGVH